MDKRFIKKRSRVINGKRFRVLALQQKKKTANNLAKGLRAHGYNSRVVKHNDGFTVYAGVINKKIEKAMKNVKNF